MDMINTRRLLTVTDFIGNVASVPSGSVWVEEITSAITIAFESGMPWPFAVNSGPIEDLRGEERQIENKISNNECPGCCSLLINLIFTTFNIPSANSSTRLANAIW